MIKIRYDGVTGKVGKSYPSTINAPTPYIEMSEAEHDQMRSTELPEGKAWFYINGELTIRADVTKEELGQTVVSKKQSVAYGGYAFTKNNIDYICSTAEKDLGKVALTLQSLSNQPDNYTLTWQVYDVEGNRQYLALTKAEFITLITEAQTFVNNQFAREAVLLAELAAQSDLTDEWIAGFKSRVDKWEV